MQSKSEQREGDFRKKIKFFCWGGENYCKVLGKGELWENFLKWVRARCGLEFFFEGGK
jgi:uncharacterized protein (DUF983 family)